MGPPVVTTTYPRIDGMSGGACATASARIMPVRVPKWIWIVSLTLLLAIADSAARDPRASRGRR